MCICVWYVCPFPVKCDQSLDKTSFEVSVLFFQVVWNTGYQILAPGISFKFLRGIKSRCDDEIALTCFWPKNMASGPLGNANSPVGTKAINPTSLDGSGIQQLRRNSTSQITPAELTRPSNIQRILQKKAQVKAYPRLKKLEKLGVYSSCKVSIV